jgi:hypothetical protein
VHKREQHIGSKEGNSMAKRNHPQQQRPSEQVQALNTRTLILNAKDDRPAPTVYANHAQFSMGENELYLDFYRIEPEPADPRNVQAFLVQRVAIPHGLAKGLATAVANLVAGFENALGIAIPLNRTPDPNDLIKIWDEQL